MFNHSSFFCPFVSTLITFFSVVMTVFIYTNNTSFRLIIRQSVRSTIMPLADWNTCTWFKLYQQISLPFLQVYSLSHHHLVWNRLFKLIHFIPPWVVEVNDVHPLFRVWDSEIASFGVILLIDRCVMLQCCCISFNSVGIIVDPFFFLVSKNSIETIH